MRKISLFIVAMLFIVVFSQVLTTSVDGDGMYIPSKPMNVHEPKQEAIIAWNADREKMILTVDIFGEEDTSGFHIIPFPAELISIDTCDASVFDHVEPNGYSFRYNSRRYTEGPVIPGGDNDSLGGNRAEEAGKVEIIEQRTIGDHDVTSIRVNNVNGFQTEFMKIVEETGISMIEWPEGMLEVITNYTSRDITHFVIDNYEIKRDQRSIDPLVFEFMSDCIFFPMEISSVLEGGTKVDLHIIHPWDIDLDMSSVDGMVLEQYEYKYDYDEYHYKYLHDAIKNQTGSDWDFFLNNTEYSWFKNTPSYTGIFFETNLKGINGDVKIYPSSIVERSTPMGHHGYGYEMETVSIPGTDVFLGNSLELYDYGYDWSTFFHELDTTEVDTAFGFHSGSILDVIELEDRNGEMSHFVLIEEGNNLNIIKLDRNKHSIDWSVPFFQHWNGDEISMDLLRGPNFNETKYVISSERGFMVMDKEDGWTSIPKHHENHMEFFDIVTIPESDVIVYYDGIDQQTVILDPFKNTMTQQKLKIMTGQTGLRTYELARFNKTCVHVEWMNNSLYGFVKAHVHGLWSYVPENLLTGDIFLDGFKIDFFQPFMDCKMFVDRETGRTVYYTFEEGEGTRLISFSTYNTSTYWEKELDDGRLEIDRMGFIDYDMDGRNEFAIQYQDHPIPRENGEVKKLMIIDPGTGSISRDLETKIDTFSLMEKNTLPGTIPFSSENNELGYIDTNDETITGPSIILDDDELDRIRYGDIDNDGEGEFLVFRYRDDKWTDLIYIDVVDNTVYSEKLVMGNILPAIAEVDGVVRTVFFARSTVYEIVIPDEVLSTKTPQLSMDQDNVHIETRIITEIEIVDDDLPDMKVEPSGILAISGLCIVVLGIPLIALKKKMGARRKRLYPLI